MVWRSTLTSSLATLVEVVWFSVRPLVVILRPEALPVVSVIVVGQNWRGGLAIGGDPCSPCVAERRFDPGSFPAAFRSSHVYSVSRMPELALRIADFGLRIRGGGGRAKTRGKDAAWVSWIPAPDRGRGQALRGDDTVGWGLGLL